MSGWKLLADDSSAPNASVWPNLSQTFTTESRIGVSWRWSASAEKTSRARSTQDDG